MKLLPLGRSRPTIAMASCIKKITSHRLRSSRYSIHRSLELVKIITFMRVIHAPRKVCLQLGMAKNGMELAPKSSEFSGEIDAD